MRKWQALGSAAALLAALLLGGCSGQQAAATPEQAATPSPAATAETTPVPAPAGNPLTGLDDADYTGKRPVAVMLRTLDGAQPQWGIASADVLIEGVTEGNTAGLMALFADVDRISKVGPVGPGRDLFLQAALPLNAMPVSIDKNIYAANLLNALAYQDLDGYHVGKTAFAFDQGRQDAGYREENCWYTTGELIRNGAASYGTALEGSNTPLFRFGTREEVAPENRSGMSLTVTFSKSDSEQLNYNTGTGLYEKLNADGSPMADADNGQQAAFTNVFVLYASSGIKDDGYTRQYDMTGGTGLYLHGGAWEQISWSKEDATGPFSLTAADGSEQTLPEKPALLASGVTDEAAAAAEAALSNAQKLIDAQAAIDQANASLAEAQTELQDAQAALDADSENADLLAARDAAQAKIDELNQTIADNQAYLDANAPQPEETAQPEATEAPAE